MICAHCNAEIGDTMKFCPKCGQKVEEVAAPVDAAPAAPVEQAQVFSQVPPQPEVVSPAQSVATPPKKPKKSKAGLVVGIVAGAAIVGAVAFAAMSIFGSPEATVTKALVQNATELKTESQTIRETLPITNQLAGLAESEGSVTFSAEYEGEKVEAAVLMDAKGQKAKVEVDMMGMLVYDVYCSSDALVLDMDDLSDPLGVNLQTLVEDLENCEYADFSEYAELYDAEAFGDMTLVQTELEEVLKNNSVALLASLNVEKGDKADIEVNGEDITATGYVITADPDKLEDVLTAMVEDIMTKENLVNYICMSYSAAYSANFGYAYVLEPDDIEDALMYMVDEVVEFAEDDLEDYPITAYLYNGRVVLLAVTDEDGEEGAGIAFNPEGKILDYIALVGLEDEEWFDVVVLENVLEDDNFTSTLKADGETYFKVDYDYTEDSDNFTVMVNDGYDKYELTLDVDATEKGIVVIGTEYEGVEMKCETQVGGLDSDWFDMPDYENVLQLSEDEISEVVMEFYYLFY